MTFYTGPAANGLAMDHLSPEHRSWNMSRIRSRGNKPEKAVGSMLHRNEFRFRLHCKTPPGTPDIMLPRYKTTMFVHGCFWHRYEGCRFAYTPKARVDFWAAKFHRNIERDERNMIALNSTDWQALVVWVCELNDPTFFGIRKQKFITATRDSTLMTHNSSIEAPSCEV